MPSIRVNGGIVIDVNDAGDTIIMPVDDETFIEKFYGLIDKLDEISDEMKSEKVKAEDERSQLRIFIDRTKGIMTEIDGMFGQDCCKKVFGDIVPSPYLIADFFEQLKPIAEQHIDERQKKIAKKYNGKRKGARTSKYRTKEEIIQDAMR